MEVWVFADGEAMLLGVTATALRWQLAGETLPLGTSRGISNEMTGTHAKVSLESGTLLVIMNSLSAPQQLTTPRMDEYH